jgi:hypothetical protein
MKVVFKKANQSCVAVGDIDNSLKALQHHVGGYIQTVTIPKTKLVIVMDEEGKLKGKESNIKYGPDIIVGDILIAAHGDNGNFRDLTFEEIEMAIDFLKSRSCRKRGKNYER